MKVSFYTYFLPKNENVICYNTFSDAIMLISKKAYDDFITNELTDFKKKYPKVFDTFINNGFIVNKNINELDFIKTLNYNTIHNLKYYHLVILPTIECNLRCWYCFETHVKGRISDEIKKRIIKHIQKKIDKNEIDSILLDFFGGEPLLNFTEDAYPLAKKVQEIMGNNNLPFSTFFTTNGTLIDKGIINKLSEINPSFQITLDGCKERHDKIRFYKSNARGSYEDIIKSIHLINTNIPESKLNIRINYDEQTLSRIDDILNDLNDLDRSRIEIHFERIWQVPGKVENRKLIDMINLFSLNGFHVSYLNWRKDSCACKADRKNEAAINYDGSVYKCTGRDFVSEKREGVLLENGDIQWKQDIEKRFEKATFENKKCLSCKMLPVCMGPCSQKISELKDKEDISSVCMFNALEMKFDEYVELLYNNRVLCDQYNKMNQE